MPLSPSQMIQTIDLLSSFHVQWKTVGLPQCTQGGVKVLEWCEFCLVATVHVGGERDDESNDEYADEKNDSDDGVDENPQNKIHKWNKFMSFKPDIPDTPVYKSKPMISKQYSQQSEVKKGQNFDNKEALVLAVRLKALNDGFQFLVDRSAPERCHLKCYQFKQCDWKLRARLWDNTEQYYITHLDDIHTCPKTQTYPNHRNANKKGLYKGTNLVVVAMDGNNQIVPIAFGICKGEIGPCWSWWMSVLKECSGDNPNLLFISDRHAVIALAMNSL
ncbi:transposase, MuDR, MULE transposase domain protein [Tanacetum coccineum]